MCKNSTNAIRKKIKNQIVLHQIVIVTNLWTFGPFIYFIIFSLEFYKNNNKTILKSAIFAWVCKGWVWVFERMITSP